MSSKGLKNFSSRFIKTGGIMTALLLALFIQGCSDVHTAVWNKAETTIDGHRIVLSPCRNAYSKTISDAPTKRNHIFGCGDKVAVQINNEELTVNGKSYGMLTSGDSIAVRNDKVFINGKEAGTIAQN